MGRYNIERRNNKLRNMMMKMPNLGLGTFRLKGQPLRDSLLQGLDLGYRHLKCERGLPPT